MMEPMMVQLRKGDQLVVYLGIGKMTWLYTAKKDEMLRINDIQVRPAHARFSQRSEGDKSG